MSSVGSKRRRRSTPPDAAPALRATESASATLADQAYRELRRRVVTVELAPGAPFSETEIAEALAIGKTPVREALTRLRLEGLVQVQPRSGYKVSDVTLQDANDICELRVVLDGESARAAAEAPRAGSWSVHAYAQHAAPYLSSIDLHDHANDGDRPNALRDWIEADRVFHLELARLSRNARLEEALDRALLLFTRLAYLSVALDPTATFPMHGHADLISAVADGDAELARTLVVDEVRNCQTQIVAALMSSASLTNTNVDLRDAHHKAASAEIAG